jgi:phosphonate transport system ATP-binding protein
VAPAVALRGVGLRHGDAWVLRHVDLEVERGEHLALIGPSGAGKTSLLGLLNGVGGPTTGTASVLGCELARASERRRRAVRARLGTVHQGLHLVERLAVVHNVSAGKLGQWPLWRAALSLAAPQATEEAHAALERVGLEDRVWERTERLSGGERQRVAVARVLVQRPEVVLADEPTSSLDRPRGRAVLELLRTAGGPGTTLVASLHDVGLALECFPRVVALHAGRVVFDGPPEEVPAGVLARAGSAGVEAPA